MALAAMDERRITELLVIIPDEVAAWFAGKDFSADYTSHNIPVWLNVFANKKAEIRSVVEIGSMEGRSAIFWLEFFPDCTLTCIDDFAHFEACFDANVAGYGSRVKKIKSRSASALDAMRHSAEPFDLAYIDGDHQTCAVLADSALVFPLVRLGGYIVWDDYRWRERKHSCPGPAIDAFLAATEGQLRVLHKGWQVIAQKLSPEIGDPKGAG